MNIEEIRGATLESDTGCWEWQRARTKAGYPVKRIGDKNKYVHRLVCELTYGEPAGRHALHSCDNPPCVNPEHLRWGTRSDNIQDSITRGRFNTTVRNRGEEHPAAKVTTEQVREMRALYASGSWTLKRLGARFDLHYTTVSSIIHRKIWKDVT